LIVFKYLRQLTAIATVTFAAGCGGGGGDIVSSDIVSSNLATGNIVQQAQADTRLSTLVDAVTAADLGQTLSGAGPYTVFAPTNEAFASLLQELGVTKEQLLGNKALLKTVLTYHVVPGRFEKAQVPVNTPIATVEGQTITVSAAGVITDQRSRTARIVQADVPANNGVVHVIDRVLLPSP
jgi:uncharacterized surface protein with fasciclin (FAS1) repeats